ncbi:hypothetical protein [Chromobacterium violaceum]|uniref:Uncharacterized protein n=1 Tax=Chromobacterium violaceum TaxID=536 RepID=A0A202BD31_CHRVL|nr:hypothetical protein [Chromobacterium violaceum]OVE49456.1 hypothetical protein CBW21_06120 [Chromobacterium violaceum]
MKSSTLTPPFQALADSVNTLHLITAQLDDLRTLMNAIARLATDDHDIRGMAIHAKGIASALHNDADALREQIETRALAA